MTRFALKAKVILHIPLVELGNDLVFVLVGVDHKLDDGVGIESVGYVHSTYPIFYQGSVRTGILAFRRNPLCLGALSS